MIWVTSIPARTGDRHEGIPARRYALIDYTLHANQLGQTGTIRVEKDQVSFERLEGTNRRTRIERQEGPVVVGPTLVGYIFRHLEALRANQILGVRLAVLDRLETIGFQLQAVEAQPGQTRIRMKPSSLLVGMLVDPVYFTFESGTGKLVRLEGRVPPKVRAGKGWRDFDARVEYRYVAGEYKYLAKAAGAGRLPPRILGGLAANPGPP